METNDSPLEIDAPVSLLPDLGAWGIEEVDKGTCLDTSENRRIIRENSGRFQPVYNSLGEDTGYIQVISESMRAAVLAAGNKTFLLTDTRNIDSDYITGMRLLTDPSSTDAVPAWVLSATKNWREVAEKRKTVPGWRPTLIGPPQRCSAIKVDGHRCLMWTNGTANYGDFCRLHVAQRSGEDPNRPHSLAQARRRLESEAMNAVDKLADLMQNADSDSVMLGAARDILDRAGIRQGIDVNTTVTVTRSAGDIVAERLDRLREGALQKQKIIEMQASAGEPDEDEVVIDAVVVEDD